MIGYNGISRRTFLSTFSRACASVAAFCALPQLAKATTPNGSNCTKMLYSGQYDETQCRGFGMSGPGTGHANYCAPTAVSPNGTYILAYGDCCEYNQPLACPGYVQMFAAACNNGTCYCINLAF
jgi:hypothetical protein